MCVYTILFSNEVEEDLKKIPRYHRNRILDEIEERLSNEPMVPAKNRKILVNLAPPWKAVSMVWELRMGDYRIFYDVDDAKKAVYVRAIRKKPHGKTTQEIL